MIFSYFGDCGVDKYADLKSSFPGGIALNGAVHARKNLLAKDTVCVVGAIGGDNNGKVVLDTIKKFKIKSRRCRLRNYKKNHT